jgi:hypothetical protein
MTREPPGTGYTGDGAENRLLFINARIFRNGTADKTHAAAIGLSSVLLVIQPFAPRGMPARCLWQRRRPSPYSPASADRSSPAASPCLP